VTHEAFHSRLIIRVAELMQTRAMTRRGVEEGRGEMMMPDPMEGCCSIWIDFEGGKRSGLNEQELVQVRMLCGNHFGQAIEQDFQAYTFSREERDLIALEALNGTLVREQM